MCGSNMFSPLQSLAQNWCVCVCLISDPNAETPPLWKKTSQSGFWVCNEEREKRWHMELKSVPDSHLDCDVHQLTVGLVTHNNVQTLHPLPPPHIPISRCETRPPTMCDSKFCLRTMFPNIREISFQTFVKYASLLSFLKTPVFLKDKSAIYLSLNKNF